MPPRSRGPRRIRLDAPNRAICPSCRFPATLRDEPGPVRLPTHDAGSGGECPASGWYRCLACRADPATVERCAHCGGRGWSPGVSGDFEGPTGRRVYIAHGPSRPGYVRLASEPSPY